MPLRCLDRPIREVDRKAERQSRTARSAGPRGTASSLPPPSDSTTSTPPPQGAPDHSQGVEEAGAPGRARQIGAPITTTPSVTSGVAPIAARQSRRAALICESIRASLLNLLDKFFVILDRQALKPAHHIEVMHTLVESLQLGAIDVKSKKVAKV